LLTENAQTIPFSSGLTHPLLPNTGGIPGPPPSYTSPFLLPQLFSILPLTWVLVLVLYAEAPTTLFTFLHSPGAPFQITPHFLSSSPAWFSFTHQEFSRSRSGLNPPPRPSGCPACFGPRYLGASSAGQDFPLSAQSNDPPRIDS